MILSWHVFCQGAFNVTPYLLLSRVKAEETRDMIKEACSIEVILCGLVIQCEMWAWTRVSCNLWGLSVPRWQGDMHGTYYAYAFNCQATLGFRN